MLLYLDIVYLSDVYDTTYIKKYPFDVILKTKPGLTAEAIEYLLSARKDRTVFDNYYLENNNKFCDFNPKFMYTVFIQCMNKNTYTNDEKIPCTKLQYLTTNNYDINVDISLSHEFTLINCDNVWYLFQSYLGTKSLEYLPIDTNIIAEFIYEIRNEFVIEKWNKLFSVNEFDVNAKTAFCIINKYFYEDTVKEKFLELVQESKIRLICEDIGATCAYLYLIDKNLDVNAAYNYLNGLCNIKIE